jgi:4-hydroxy-4-methyl-2-oxoglutarate aldolase
MIGAPPVLTLKRDFARPSAAQSAAFAEVPTGFVVDAQNGTSALDQGIKPLWDCRFAGPAVTARCGPRDNLGAYVALRIAQPGDVLVLRTGDHLEAAVIGDNFAAIAKNLGIAAIVTDGLVRDLEGLEQVGLPVFCRGLTPNSPFKNGPCEVGAPLSLGGMPIASGDLLVGDRDGVTVIPRAQIDQVVAALAEVRRKEQETQARIAAGATIPPWVDELIVSPQTRNLD